MAYFDNSATTKICPEALKKYVSVTEETYGNPSSLHAMGFVAQKELDEARRHVRNSIDDKTAEVIFTSSGTEANNLAITGRALSKERYRKGARIITTDSEHASVTAPLAELQKMGFDIVKIPTRGGKLDLDALKSAMTDKVILVTMMLVNNETGAAYDIKEVSKLMKAASPEAVLHVDATQAYLKLPFTKRSLGADMITVSSHKIEGPKGVGALIIDKNLIKTRGISPIVFGGGQEGGLRSGTENVPAIAAFGEAARIGYSSLRENAEATEALRAHLISRLTSEDRFAALSLTLPEAHAPHILNVTLPSIKSETMLHFLSSRDFYVSSGSACSSNSHHTSSALVAYGRSAAEADTSIRISFSHNNTIDEIDAFLEALAEGLSRLARIHK